MADRQLLDPMTRQQQQLYRFATSARRYSSKAGTPVYCPLPEYVITALDATIRPSERFYFWTGNGKVNTVITDWQEKLEKVFELA